MSLSAEAQAIVNAMSAPPAQYYQDAIDALCISLVSSGVFAKLLGLWDLGGPTQADSLINFITPGTNNCTQTGSVTWTKGQGMATDGSTGYLDCGFAPNVGGLVSQNSVSVHNFHYHAAANNYQFGQLSSSNFRLGVLSVDGKAGRVNSATTASSTSNPPSHFNDALISIMRRISTEVEIWWDGALDTTVTGNNSASPSSGHFTFFRTNATFANLNSVMRLGAIGAPLSAGEMTALKNAIFTYHAATGPRFFLLTFGGQSNLDRMFRDDSAAGSGDDTQNSRAALRVLTPALQAFLDAQFSEGRTNLLTLVNGSASGATVLGTSGGSNSWWDYINHLPMDDMTAWQTLIHPFLVDGHAYNIQMAWAQGEADVAFVPATWTTATQEVFAYMRTYMGTPTCPIVIHPLGRNFTADSTIKSFRAQQVVQDLADANVYIGPEVEDIQRITSSDWHAVSDIKLGNNPVNGYDRMALFVARASAFIWGCTGVVWKGPEIASAVKSGASTVDVTLTYPSGSGGTDFTPTTGIVGFNLTDSGGAKTITSAVRTNATTVRLTTSAPLLSSIQVNYDNSLSSLDRTAMVRDNFTLPMPMRWSDFISVTESGGAVTVDSGDQPTGGWFIPEFERELVRRKRERERLDELENETDDIPDSTDREIAEFMREQERKDQKRAELERLKALAKGLDAKTAERVYGERVAKALTRAIEKSTFSTLDALDRELSRTIEEEAFLLDAAMLLLED